MTASEFAALQRTERQSDSLGLPDRLSITSLRSTTSLSSCYQSASFKNRRRRAFIDHQEAGKPVAREGHGRCPGSCLWPGPVPWEEGRAGICTPARGPSEACLPPAFPQPRGVLLNVGCILDPEEVILGLWRQGHGRLPQI